MKPLMLDVGPTHCGFHYYEDFIRCACFFAMRRAKIVEDEREPLVRGSLVHLGCAQWRARILAETPAGFTWKGKVYRDPALIEKPLVAMTRKAEATPVGSLWSRMLPACMEMVKAYTAVRSIDRREPILVEGVFEATLATERWGGFRSIPYRQRADWASRSRDGGIWLEDIKVVGRWTDLVLQRYMLSGQFIGYSLFGRAKWGEQFRGVKLDVIEAQLPYKLVSREVNIGAWPLLRYVDSIVYHGARLRHLEGMELDPWLWPRNFSEHGCGNGAYGPCPAFDLCHRGPPADRDDLWDAEPGSFRLGIDRAEPRD